MSSNNKLARKIDAGQSVPAKKRGVMPFRQRPTAQGRTIKNSALGCAGNGEGTTGISQEESYQLCSHPQGSTLPFAMMIRLTPEILEELKHAEEKVVALRMKCGNNVGSHVIEVGPEIFKFSSAPEPGGLCDIYTEQVDENGQQMLREAGSAWRKLSLQRILSASEKDRVKQRTAEVEKRQKLRKSILVDQNTQMNIPQAALTDVESNKSLLGMEQEPSPKKRKVTKSAMPSVQKQTNATALIGSHYLPSPDSPLPELMSTVARETSRSPPVVLPGSKGKHTNGGEAHIPIVKTAVFSQKQSAVSKANMTSIRNVLISLLQESPKGMTIKALEKAVTESLSVSPERKLFEKIIKSIATFHAPGKYILNPGVEKGTFVEAVASSSRKSPERACDGAKEEEPPTDLMEETICQEAIDLDRPEGSYNKLPDYAAEHVSPPLVSSQLCIAYEFDGKSPRLGETDAKAAGSRCNDSSSTEESESESHSSGNGSASSTTESSSSTESDASSSSSDASMDEDVDIMSDGEDEKRSDIIKQKAKADVKFSANETSMLFQADFRNTDEMESGALGRGNPTPGIHADFTITKEIDSGATGNHIPTPELQADFRSTESNSGAMGRCNPIPEIQADSTIREVIESGAFGRTNPISEIQADFTNTEKIESRALGRHNPIPEIQADFRDTEEIESGALGRRNFGNEEEIGPRTSGRRNPTPETQPSFLGEVRSTLEDMKVREPDCMADSQAETVLGPEENVCVMIHSNVLLGNDNLKNALNFDHISSKLSKKANIQNSPHCQIAPSKEIETFSETPDRNREQEHQEIENFSETPDRNREQEHQGSQERRKRYSFDQSTSPSHVDARAGKRAKQLDILVDNIFQDKGEVSVDTWCVKSNVHQTMDRSPLNKMFETAENKDIDRHSQKRSTSYLNKKENANSVLTGEKLSTSSLSLEARKQKLEGSSLGAKDRPQRRVGRPSREGNSGSQLHIRQHSSMKPDRLTTTDQRKKHGKEADKHGAAVVTSSENNGRASSQIASISSRPGDGLHNNVKGFLGKVDPFKEGVNESSMHKLTNSRDPSARLMKDAGGNKATLLGFTKEQDALEIAKTIKDIEKASRPNSLELAERTAGSEAQVEKPLKDAGSLNQGREYERKDGLKEELNARPPNNSISSKEGRKMGIACMDSGHSGHRGSFHEMKRNDSQALELGEFREPPSENELRESRSLCLRREQQCFEVTSRATLSPDPERQLPVPSSRPDGIRASPLPDFERPLPFRGSSRVIKASPGQEENSSLQEMLSRERITQDAKRAESYRPFKKNLGAGQPMQKLGADQVRQLHYGKPVSATKELGGSTRSVGSDVQDPRDGFKESSRKNCNKLLGDSKASTLIQQKASNARSFSDNEKIRQDRIARDLQTSCKKQTPQSSEVQGGEFFTPFEKEEPELRGTIYSLDQFRDYYKEYNEKYPIYAQLNASLENDKENFETFLKDIEEAKRRGDMAKLARIHGRVRKEYFQCRKRFKRMRHTLKVLHEELQVIKQHCKDYAQNIKQVVTRL